MITPEDTPELARAAEASIVRRMKPGHGDTAGGGRTGWKQSRTAPLIFRLIDIMKRLLSPPSIVRAIIATVIAATFAPAAEPSLWHGFERTHLAIDGHAAFVTKPKIAAPGKPWVWRTSFPDYHAETAFEREQAGRVVFLGGSITYSPGWRDAVMRYLRQRFSETQLDFIAAGIPSLGSVPHAFRLGRDVFAHEQVAERYGCPSLNLARDVHDRIAAGQFTWKEDFRDLHPSPYGQQVYAHSINRLLDAAWQDAAPAGPRPHPLPGPLDPASYDRGRFGELERAKLVRGFTLDPAWRPADGKGTRAGYVNVPALIATEPGAEFEFPFEGSAIGLMITSGPDAGTFTFRIDDGPETTTDTRTPWSDQLHLPWALILADGLPDGPHILRVRLTDGALRVLHFLENAAPRPIAQRLFGEFLVAQRGYVDHRPYRSRGTRGAAASRVRRGIRSAARCALNGRCDPRFQPR